jgi:hypothetical protein
MSDFESIGFSESDAARSGRLDAESMVDISTSQPPAYLAQAKLFFESKIRALESDLVQIANRTAGNPDIYTPGVLDELVEADLKLWNDIHEPDLERLVEIINNEEFDSTVHDHNIDQVKEKLDIAKDDLISRTEQWREVEHGRPHLNNFVKWLVIILFAVAEIVANIDWLNGLLADVESPFSGVSPKIFILLVAFVVSLGLMMIGEKAGGDLRQKNPLQMAWKLVALAIAGSTIAYYRDLRLARAEATDAEGNLDLSQVTADPSRFGVSLAIFLIFSSISLIVGYYSSHTHPEFTSRQNAFTVAQKLVEELSREYSLILEGKQKAQRAFAEVQMRRVGELKRDFSDKKNKERARLESEYKEKHPIRFYEQFAAVRKQVEEIMQSYYKVRIAYFNAYSEVDNSFTPPTEVPSLTVPERLAVDNADPALFRGI